MMEYTLKDARDQLGEIVTRVQTTHEPVTVTRYGKTVAVIIDVEEYTALDAARDRLDAAIVNDRIERGAPTVSLDDALKICGVTPDDLVA